MQVEQRAVRDIFPAKSPEEFRELMRSRPEDYDFIRTAADWEREARAFREPGGPLATLSQEQFDAFDAGLSFRNGGVAGLEIGILINNLVYRDAVKVLDRFGVDPTLKAIHIGWKCSGPGNCVRSDDNHACTDNC